VIGTDLYPTLVDVAGADIPPGQLLDGSSLLPVLTDSDAVLGRDIFWHFPAYLEADRSVQGTWRTTPASAVRRGGYKLLHFFEDDRWELYDVEEDVSESRDLSRERPDLLRQMRSSLEAWWVATDADFVLDANPAYDPSG
jgi:arylsulfatase A-like enzyme